MRKITGVEDVAEYLAPSLLAQVQSSCLEMYSYLLVGKTLVSLQQERFPNELAEYLCLENRKDARLTLEALYRAGLIDIKVEVGKRFGAKIKLNWNEMKKERLEAIEKLPRTEKITYCTDGEGTTTGTTEGTNCTATLEQEIEIEIEKEIEKEQFYSSVISPEEYQEIYSNPILREVQFTMDDVEKAKDNPYEETNPFILDFERRYDT